MRYVICVVVLMISSLCVQLKADQAPSAKGTVEISYKKKLLPEDRIEASKKAKIKALDRYFEEHETANQKNYEIMREKIITNIEDYILSSVTLVEENDEKNKKYTLVIRIDINERKLNNTLLNSSTVANIKDSEKSMMTFVFVAREKSSVQSFEDKKYSRTDVSTQGNDIIHAKQQQTNTGSESEKINKSAVQTSDQINKSFDQNIQSKNDASQSVTTGGSTTRKADVNEWNVSSTQNLDAVFTKLFTDAGFQVFAAGDVEQETNGLLQTSAFTEDYRHGDDISPKTRTNATKGVKGLGFKYLAIGTLDIGMSDIDPVSGMKRVYVNVTAKILDVSGPFAKAVTSIGPVQFSGIGPDSDVARVNAMQLAAKSAGTQLVNELNAKSVH